jgi:hypothetical protein
MSRASRPNHRKTNPATVLAIAGGSSAFTNEDRYDGTQKYESGQAHSRPQAASDTHPPYGAGVGRVGTVSGVWEGRQVMIISNTWDYSPYSTGMHFPEYHHKGRTRYGEKVHLFFGAPICGSGSGWNRHPHRRYMADSTPITCEKCLAHEQNWQRQAWLIFMESEH